MFYITDNKIPHKCLDDDGTKTKNLSREPWYIIADILDFWQSQLHHILPEEPPLSDLSYALIRHNIDGEIPHYVVVEK